jgi:hypothetical protein
MGTRQTAPPSRPMAKLAPFRAESLQITEATKAGVDCKSIGILVRFSLITQQRPRIPGLSEKKIENPVSDSFFPVCLPGREQLSTAILKDFRSDSAFSSDKALELPDPFFPVCFRKHNLQCNLKKPYQDAFHHRKPFPDADPRPAPIRPVRFVVFRSLCVTSGQPPCRVEAFRSREKEHGVN